MADVTDMDSEHAASLERRYLVRFETPFGLGVIAQSATGRVSRGNGLPTVPGTGRRPA